MKNLLIAVSISSLIILACNGKDDKSASDKNNSVIKTKHYLNYDDELDIKSTASVDTTKFRETMNQILPSKRIIELFGSGYQIFYLALDIEANGKTYCQITPEGGSWITGLGQIEKGLFSENIEVENDYTIIPQSEGDAKAVNIKNVFYSFHGLLGRTFSASPGMLNGKKVKSRKAFQIDITIGNSGEVIKPWTITEIDISKFRPKLKNNLGKEYYMGFFPAVLKDDYKSLRTKIEVPKEAISRGVRGKVFMKLFFEGDGKYAGYQLIKGLGYGCEEAVIKALNDYPLQSYPSGERTTLVLPFNFGKDKSTQVDLYSTPLIYFPEAKYNQLQIIIKNKITSTNLLSMKYKVSIFLDGKSIFYDGAASIPTTDRGIRYSFGGRKIESGTHDYNIYVDAENVLNDIDRSNNVVKGKLVIK